jgi:hypothetical protein
VATAILGVAVVTLLGLHARNLALVSEAETVTVATTLAGDVLAAARLEPGISVGESVGTFVARRTDADGINSIYGGELSPPFVWKREVTETALPNLLQIRITVHYPEDDHVFAEMWAAVRTQPVTSP